MSIRKQFAKLMNLEALPHRPPLSPRFWVYSATAYIVPVVVQVAFPEDPTFTDELVWLITLVPAYLLSLHYGLSGAFVALILGTALFLVVQLVVAVNFTPDDWRITMPIYLAYGVLSISVGWMSERLHDYYNRVLKDARMAAIGQLALTVKYEVDNALAPLIGDAEALVQSESLSEEHSEPLQRILSSAQRISKDMERLSKLEDAPVMSVIEGVDMLDLSSAQIRTPFRE
jgi:hypothetical protein